jgi:hypothetical protein
MLVWGAGTFGSAVFLGERACYGRICRIAQMAAVVGGVQFVVVVAMMVRGVVLLGRGEWEEIVERVDLETGGEVFLFDVKKDELL